jgi:chromosomal replication initiation ATPase DnaA
LERRHNPVSFYTWFSSIRLVADDGDRLTIAVKDPVSAQWIPRKYADVLQEALAEAGRHGATIVISREPARR